MVVFYLNNYTSLCYAIEEVRNPRVISNIAWAVIGILFKVALADTCSIVGTFLEQFPRFGCSCDCVQFLHVCVRDNFILLSCKKENR